MEEAKLREEEAMKTGWFVLLNQQVAGTMYCIPLNSMYFSLGKNVSIHQLFYARQLCIFMKEYWPLKISKECHKFWTGL